uniref:Uncharacterized protein n=1 Tax=Anguilla anguilla TaxID=7936 RepID=A0A0E9PNV8_ANGAN
MCSFLIFSLFLSPSAPLRAAGSNGFHCYSALN